MKGILQKMAKSKVETLAFEGADVIAFLDIENDNALTLAKRNGSSYEYTVVGGGGNGINVIGGISSLNQEFPTVYSLPTIGGSGFPIGSAWIADDNNLSIFGGFGSSDVPLEKGDLLVSINDNTATGWAEGQNNFFILQTNINFEGVTIGNTFWKFEKHIILANDKTIGSESGDAYHRYNGDVLRSFASVLNQTEGDKIAAISSLGIVYLNVDETTILPENTFLFKTQNYGGGNVRQEFGYKQGEVLTSFRIRGTGQLGADNLPEFADNAAALAGGLVEGDFYHTAGALKVTLPA